MKENDRYIIIIIILFLGVGFILLSQAQNSQADNKTVRDNGIDNSLLNINQAVETTQSTETTESTTSFKPTTSIRPTTSIKPTNSAESIGSGMMQY